VYNKLETVLIVINFRPTIQVFQNTIGSVGYKMLTVTGEATMGKIGQVMLDSSPRMWKWDLQLVNGSCIPNKDTLIKAGSKEVTIWRVVDMVDWIISGRTL